MQLNICNDYILYMKTAVRLPSPPPNASLGHKKIKSFETNLSTFY